MNSNTVVGVLILALAAVVIAVIIAANINNMNYDNQRMLHGYCESFIPGNGQRLLVKCP